MMTMVVLPHRKLPVEPTLSEVVDVFRGQHPGGRDRHQRAVVVEGSVRGDLGEAGGSDQD